jgi:hypothetical protein
MTDGLKALGAGGDVTVDLSDARIGSTLAFDPERLENTTNPYALIQVDGLTYSGLPVGITSDRWLSLLRERDTVLRCTAIPAVGFRAPCRRARR